MAWWTAGLAGITAKWLERLSLPGVRWGRVGRLSGVHRALRLPTLDVVRAGAGLAAVAVNAVALIRELAWIDILTLRGQVVCFTGLSIAVDSQTLTLP